MASNFLSGIGADMRELVRGKRPDQLRDKADRPDRDILALDGTVQHRIRKMVQRYYNESAYEKIPLARKWTRNSLLYQGYHDLEWSLASSSWETATEEFIDFAFPNNYFRSQILYGVSMYIKSPPKFSFGPTATDYESQAIAQATMKALPVIQKNVNYEVMRAWEALFLRLYGNAFRYSYYSLDARYGTITVPVYDAVPQEMEDPETGETHLIPVPQVVGEVLYPRGQEVTDVVHPLEVYVRSNSINLQDTPFLVRARLVDKKRLQASFQDMKLGGGSGRYTDDLSINYKEMLSELSGDSINPVAWYSQASKDEGTIFIQAWIRPAMYWDDKELLRRFPHGMYAAVNGDTLLETRDESLDDHWVHMLYKMVPGRFWGDGEDDLVPKQLQLNTTEQLITKNIAYNSVPQTWVKDQTVNKDRITNDPGEVNVVKNIQGQKIKDSIMVTPGQNLSQETYAWRGFIKEDMEFHSNTPGSAIGRHQPGVDTLGGQQMFAASAESNLSPMQVLYKQANEEWARQVIRLAAMNWIDERVSAVEGMNGQWEFTKLKRAALDPDRVIINARILPVDFAQQQAFTQAIAVGALNPQDPRVANKALELYNLPIELNAYSMDAKVQWKEIDRMKMGNPVPIRPFIDANPTHIEICRIWLNSDEAEQEDPQIYQLVYTHMLEHVKLEMQIQSMMAKQAGQLSKDSGENPGEQKANTKPKGSPPDRAARKKRAIKGQAAKPKTSQPSSGNQYRRGKR